MRVLVACERSGVVREAFRAMGHDAYSCDLVAADDGSPHHLAGDCLWWAENWHPFDLMVAHPPCTYLSVSGLHWNGRRPGRAALTEQALAFVTRLMSVPIPRVCIENPVGLIGSRLRPASQWVQPYEYGDDASKRTGLWLRGLPRLVADPADRVPGRIVQRPDGRPVERWANQTDSGQNRLGPSPERARLRAETYPGLARAMARQWGGLPPLPADALTQWL